MIGLKVRRVRNHVPHADHEWSNHECLAYITHTNAHTRSASRFHESFYTEQTPGRGRQNLKSRPQNVYHAFLDNCKHLRLSAIRLRPDIRRRLIWLVR
jgi:hypothetical protein